LCCLLRRSFPSFYPRNSNGDSTNTGPHDSTTQIQTNADSLEPSIDPTLAYARSPLRTLVLRARYQAMRHLPIRPIRLYGRCVKREGLFLAIRRSMGQIRSTWRLVGVREIVSRPTACDVQTPQRLRSTSVPFAIFDAENSISLRPTTKYVLDLPQAYGRV
jgi:hypothetical protein